MELIYNSYSAEDTIKLGIKLGNKLRGDEVILLQGDLGTGKTLLTQAICKGLGVEDYVSSPSFTLVNQYQGRARVYHLDLYRLEREEDLFDIGFEEILHDEAVVIIEWPELGFNFIPPEFLLIRITRVEENPDFRKITFEDYGETYKRLIGELKEDACSGN